ncbi:MAG: DUF4838 domain-containing protein [Lentisphaerae bacterium]|nr:DUF4838 domain-containing protein [Lentisphaerota bacterium]
MNANNKGNVMESVKSIRAVLLLRGCLGLCLLSAGASHAAEKLVLVEDGVSRAPIVIYQDMPPLTRMAAEELAEYIEKSSGARPEIIEGLPDPLPDHAIWVGYQPVLNKIFPDVDFDFKHPEEILIAANTSHLVIAGRDIWDPANLVVEGKFSNVEGVQQEYGTHNAVYTFLHDQLGVRWLWPGELGEDVPENKTIALDPFVYRYHPQVVSRGSLFAYSTLHRVGTERREPYSGGAPSGYWLRAQRLQLDSMPYPGGGGGFGKWWERFHETHPDYFALQPGGKRDLCTKPGNVKLCVSNPAVWEQWVADVAVQLEEDPNLRAFNGAPGDGYHHGHCICDNCRDWDHPDGEPRRLIWQGLAQEYVSLTERYVIFANHLARLLKERFPDKELYVYTYAYGHTRPAPVEVVPDDNVIIGNVANFLLRGDGPDGSSIRGTTKKEQYAGWGQVTKMHFWRPNVGNPVGFQRGFPDVPLQRTIEDMKFAAEYGLKGIYVDPGRARRAAGKSRSRGRHGSGSLP